MNIIEYIPTGELLAGRPAHRYIDPSEPREEDWENRDTGSKIEITHRGIVQDMGRSLDTQSQERYIGLQFQQFVESFLPHCRRRTLNLLYRDGHPDNGSLLEIRGMNGEIVLSIGNHYVRVDQSGKCTIIRFSERPSLSRWHTSFTSFDTDTCRNEIRGTRNWYQFGTDHMLYRRLMDFADGGPRVEGEELDVTIRELLLPMIERVDRILAECESGEIY